MSAESHFIRVYEKVIPDVTCDSFVNAFEDLHKRELTSRFDEEYRRCTILGFPHSSANQETSPLYSIMCDYTKTTFERYKSDIGYTNGSGTLGWCTKIEKPNMIRYVPNTEKQEYFHNHADNWNNDSSTRQVSIIIYLNDVDEGGATNFPFYNISVKPKKGTILMFPSFYTYTHHGEQPKSGSKYIIVTWLHFGLKNTHYLTYDL